MVNLNLLSTLLLTALLLIITIFAFLDARHKRTLRKKPQVSFLIPCYNDGKSVGETIQSVYDAYDPQRFELLVVNDKSTDNSPAILKRLQRKYRFTLVNNKVNKGKSASLNKLAKRAKYDILFVVDADIVVHRGAVEDILARLQEERVAAVSAQFMPKKSGFFQDLQAMEYTMLLFVQMANNRFSTPAMCGACFGIRRHVFEKVGGLSENAILEDMDLALKIHEAGYYVEQSLQTVQSTVPNTLAWWYKQKVRWGGGALQNIIKHFTTWVKNPLTLAFILLFFSLDSLMILSLTHQALQFETLVRTAQFVSETTYSLITLKAVGLRYGALLLKRVLILLWFTIFSTPYAVPLVKGWKSALKILYSIPFALVYIPAFGAVSLIGGVNGLARYRSLKRGGRAW